MTTPNALQVQAFHTTDVTEQVRATPGWQQQYRQMSPGHFSGELRCLGLDGVEVYEERLNTRVEQFFRPPSGSLAFCFDRSENSLYLLNEQSRNIWITPENYEEVAVVFDQAFLARHGLDTQRLDGLFMVPLGSGQNALFGSWLSATLTRLGHADCPLQGQALAEQLLEDCLFILDSACQRLDGGALGRRSEAREIMRRVSEWAADCPEETLNLMALADVAGGHVQILLDSIISVQSMAKSGKVKPIAVTSTQRSGVAPDVPTAVEAGVKGFQASSWNALAVPGKTPRPVIDRLNKDIVAALAKPEVKKKLADLNIDADQSTPDEAAQLLASDIQRWAAVIQRAGIPKQ